MQAARRIGAAVTTRATLLAELFNSAALGVGVAGTSGKSTTVGMLGSILHRAGREPDDHEWRGNEELHGCGLACCQRQDRRRTSFSSVRWTRATAQLRFYEPRVAVVNNISLDHKSSGRAAQLSFRGFVAKAQTVVLNLDNAETAALLAGLQPGASGHLQSGCCASPPRRVSARPLARWNQPSERRRARPRRPSTWP